MRSENVIRLTASTEETICFREVWTPDSLAIRW
jgi:hypothetical protein